MDGILNINKPAGITSFRVVAMVRRLSKERRVGHAGTLDPAATGVLPVCLGRGARIIEFLMDTTKKYLAEIELGTATDTYDSEGKTTRRGDATDINRERLETAIDAFRGAIRQIPPMYSAVKHKGRPLYKLAREGIEIERKSRPVTIHRLEITDWQPPVATVEVECGKGTYIRSLAHDLGEALGCGAHLKNLARTGCGVFDIKDSIEMSELEKAFHHGYWQHYLYPIDSALSHQEAVVVNNATAEMIKRGSPVVLEADNLQKNNGKREHQYCRVYTVDGDFLGILNSIPGEDVWMPKKVFI